ncbi:MULTISPECIES: LysR family transcriptional regulator [Pasteurellaceae]|uniref:LysR family transcriptional regulator n=1 Tax=Pasteurellaceae TaxID=712 RepID=UPI0035670F31
MNKYEALRHFCTLADTMSFKETANKLAVSPQVVTRMITELEQYLGEMLFKRNTRNVKLTPFGEYFLPKAQRLWAESERLFTPPGERNEMSGIVRITLPPLLQHQTILQALLAKLVDFPDLILDWRVSLHAADSVEEQIDIGIRAGNSPHPQFIVVPIATFSEVIVASPDLLAQYGTPHSLDELMAFPLSGLLNPNTGKMWHWFFGDNRMLVPKNPRFISNDQHAELTACLSGRCISMLNYQLCQPYLARGELHQLLPDIPMPAWQLYLYRPYQAVTPPRVQRVFNILEAILRKIFA